MNYVFVTSLYTYLYYFRGSLSISLYCWRNTSTLIRLRFLGSRSTVFRPAKRRKEITVILTWMQAFSVYTLVLTTYWLARITDLLKYQLLIMRSAQQFAGSTWLSYFRAFRRQAAACHQTDSSYMNSELYYFRVSAAVAVAKSPSASIVSNASSLSSSSPVETWAVAGLEAHGLSIAPLL